MASDSTVANTNLSQNPNHTEGDPLQVQVEDNLPPQSSHTPPPNFPPFQSVSEMATPLNAIRSTKLSKHSPAPKRRNSSHADDANLEHSDVEDEVNSIEPSGTASATPFPDPSEGFGPYNLSYFPTHGRWKRTTKQHYKEWCQSYKCFAQLVRSHATSLLNLIAHGIPDQRYGKLEQEDRETASVLNEQAALFFQEIHDSVQSLMEEMEADTTTWWNEANETIGHWRAEAMNAVSENLSQPGNQREASHKAKSFLCALKQKIALAQTWARKHEQVRQEQEAARTSSRTSHTSEFAAAVSASEPIFPNPFRSAGAVSSTFPDARHPTINLPNYGNNPFYATITSKAAAKPIANSNLSNLAPRAEDEAAAVAALSSITPLTERLGFDRAPPTVPASDSQTAEKDVDDQDIQLLDASGRHTSAEVRKSPDHPTNLAKPPNPSTNHSKPPNPIVAGQSEEISQLTKLVSSLADMHKTAQADQLKATKAAEKKQLELAQAAERRQRELAEAAEKRHAQLIQNYLSEFQKQAREAYDDLSQKVEQRLAKLPASHASSPNLSENEAEDAGDVPQARTHRVGFQSPTGGFSNPTGAFAGKPPIPPRPASFSQQHPAAHASNQQPYPAARAGDNPRSLNLSKQSNLSTLSTTTSTKRVLTINPTEPEPFSGNFQDWPRFWEQWTNYLNEVEVPKLSQMRLLRKLLRGGAKETADVYPESAQALDELIAVLKRRYDNPEALANFSRQALENLSPPSRETASELRSFHTKLVGLKSNLERYGEEVNLPVYYGMIMRKLPQGIRQALTKQQTLDSTPWNVDRLVTAIEAEVCCAERMAQMDASILPAPTFPAAPKRHAHPPPHRTFAAQNPQTEEVDGEEAQRNRAILPRKPSQKSSQKRWDKLKDKGCVFCNKLGHYSSACEAYPTASARKEKLHESKRCLNCTHDTHLTAQCPVKLRQCKHCARGHHSFLCHEKYRERPRNTDPPNHSALKTPPKGKPHTSRTYHAQQDEDNESTASDDSRPLFFDHGSDCFITDDEADAKESETDHHTGVANNDLSHAKQTLLSGPAERTLLLSTMLQVSGPRSSRKRTEVSVFFDLGSTQSFITKRLAQSLKLPIKSTYISRVSGFGGKLTENSVDKCDISIFPRHDSGPLKVEVEAVDKISDPMYMPAEHNATVQYALNHPDQPVPVVKREPDILIGIDLYPRFNIHPQPRPFPNGLYLFTSATGDLLGGKGMLTGVDKDTAQVNFCHSVQNLTSKHPEEPTFLSCQPSQAPSQDLSAPTNLTQDLTGDPTSAPAKRYHLHQRKRASYKEVNPRTGNKPLLNILLQPYH